MSNEDFEFNVDDMELDEEELNRMDNQFINAIQERTEEYHCQHSNDLFSYWFLILMSVFIVFFIGVSLMWILKGRRLRLEHTRLGYRKV
jgi:hypothetical protein